MKKLILSFIVCLLISLQGFTQREPKMMFQGKEAVDNIQKQLQIRHKKAVNTIYAGAIITGVGVATTAFGITKYLEHSEKVIDDSYDGLLNVIINNQAQMNKSIPSALIATSGVVLAGVGATIIIKGVMKKNDVEFAIKTYGQGGTGMGVTINF